MPYDFSQENLPGEFMIQGTSRPLLDLAVGVVFATHNLSGIHAWQYTVEGLILYGAHHPREATVFPVTLDQKHLSDMLWKVLADWDEDKHPLGDEDEVSNAFENPHKGFRLSSETPFGDRHAIATVTRSYLDLGL